jgi:phosphoglycerate dehydrogenase-like enzyme
VNVLISIHSQFAMWNIPAAHVDALRAEFPAHAFLVAHDDDHATALISEAEAAFSGHVPPGQLAVAPRLRWIHSPAAGVGGMMYPEMLARPVIITNSRGMSADTMAEHVIAVTLAMFRQLPSAVRSQDARVWAQDAIAVAGNRQLAGSRVLVVGLGAIGGAVARRMAALGARVSGIRRRPSRDPEGIVNEVAPVSRLKELLPAADIVVIAAPHTRETRALIGKAELAVMGRNALLVNVSRGQLIDEPALIEALRAGTIGGAALDVFVDEPLPPESPFWTLPNVLITPHTSGFRPDHWQAATAIFAENLRRYDASQPLLNVIDKNVGY